MHCILVRSNLLVTSSSFATMVCLMRLPLLIGFFFSLVEGFSITLVVRERNSGIVGCYWFQGERAADAEKRLSNHTYMVLPGLPNLANVFNAPLFPESFTLSPDPVTHWLVCHFLGSFIFLVTRFVLQDSSRTNTLSFGFAVMAFNEFWWCSSGTIGV